MAEFVHLHNHSDFSLLRASSTVSGLVKKSRKLAMPALAITDDGNLFGALRFYKECMSTKDKNDNPLPTIKPIIGCDFFLAPASRHEKQAGENGAKFSRLVLLAQSDFGYRNLCKLSSLGYTEGFYYRPRVDKETLATYSGDLIALSGSTGGEIPQLIMRNRLDEAKAAAIFYKELYGPGKFYLELCDHGIPDQKIINNGLMQLAKELDLPLVAANDTYYLNADDAEAHDVLLCINGKRKKNDGGRFRFSTNEFYLKSAEEMESVFGHLPETLKNTLVIAEMCNIKLTLPGPLLPDYEIPPEFISEAPQLVGNELERLKSRFVNESDDIRARLNEPVTQYFVWESNEGLKKRFVSLNSELTDRLDFELFVIIKMGFIGYFLIVWDFIRYAKENDIPVGPGRGSGAGSLVAYSLKITDIDPLRYKLLFERFLNPERVSMPDFDIDFCFERRQEVIDYVTRKYGNKKVGQIITFGTLKPKMVLKDVARALDISFEEANLIVKSIPDGPLAAKLHLSDLLSEKLDENWVKQGYQKQADEVKEIYGRGGIYKELFDISVKLEGLSRHASTHAAGIVIGKDELTNYVPLYRDAKTGAISTQFTMDLLEECGLVKMDFLGLKTLTLIKNTEDIIRQNGQADFSIETVSEDDKKTYDMLGEGRSAAVFQFDGEGMQRTIKLAKPTCIDDLTALTSLYRPGPLEYIPQFVDSKWGRQAIVYPHPSLEALLKETYGVMVYQEQVMQAAQIVGGYTLGGADLLRRAMGKKKKEEMAKHRVIFSEGAQKAHGLNPEKAGEIFDILEKFAGYGFNKSHAAAYSVLSFRTAYLKSNFPAEFMAANLTNEINSPDDFKLYLTEAKGMGLTVLAPEINLSEKFFSVTKGAILFGLIGLKGIGSAVVDEILEVRKNGPYTSLNDFLERVDLRTVNKKSVETLILSGAMRNLCPVRKQAVEQLEVLFHQAHNKKEDLKSGQASLFGEVSEESFETVKLDGEEFELLTLLMHEKSILGYYFSGHPLDHYRADWERACTLDLSRPQAASKDKIYHLVAMVCGIRTLTTKRGSLMCIVSFEDYNGNLESVLFSENYEKFKDFLVEERVLGLSVKVDFGRELPQLIIESIMEPGELPEKEAGEVHLLLKPNAEKNETEMLKLRELVLNNSGRCWLYLHLQNKEKTTLRVSGQLQVRSMPEVLARFRTSPLVEDAWKLFPAMGPYGESKALAKKRPITQTEDDEDESPPTDSYAELAELEGEDI